MKVTTGGVTVGVAALMGKVDPTARRRRIVDDEFTDPTPFEELLRRSAGDR